MTNGLIWNHTLIKHIIKGDKIMKLSCNRFALVPHLCLECKRYIWLEGYRRAEVWKNFTNIVEGNQSGIDVLTNEKEKDLLVMSLSSFLLFKVTPIPRYGRKYAAPHGVFNRIPILTTFTWIFHFIPSFVA